MPTVEISRSRSRLPTSSGIRQAGRVNPDRKAGKALQEIGEQLSLAADANYVATTGVHIQAAMEQAKSARQQQFFDNPTGYANAVNEDFKRISEEALGEATSLRARTTLQSQLASVAKSTNLQANLWEKKASLDSFLAKHQESVNILSNQVAQNPILAMSAMDSLKGLQEGAKLYLDPAEYRKLEDTNNRQIAEAQLIGTIGTNPSAAKSLLKTEEFQKMFDAREIQGFENKIEAKVKKEKVGAVAAQGTAGANSFIMSATGKNNLASIDSDPDLSDRDKEISKALLLGDEEIFESLRKKMKVTKGSIEGLDEDSIISDGRAIMNKYIQSNKDDDARMEALKDLNELKNRSALARALGGNKNRGNGLNARTFSRINKNITSKMDLLMKDGDEQDSGSFFGDPTFVRTRYDTLYEEIEELVGDGKDAAPLRAELMAYAGSIAEQRNIPLHDGSLTLKTDENVRRIMEEVKFRRRQTLGIPADAPNVGTAIVDGRKQNLGKATEQSGQADRGITGQPRIRVNRVIRNND